MTFKYFAIAGIVIALAPGAGWGDGDIGFALLAKKKQALSAVSETEVQAELALETALLARVLGDEASFERLLTKFSEVPQFWVLTYLHNKAIGKKSQRSPKSVLRSNQQKLKFSEIADYASTLTLQRWLAGNLSCVQEKVDPVLCGF